MDTSNKKNIEVVFYDFSDNPWGNNLIVNNNASNKKGKNKLLVFIIILIVVVITVILGIKIYNYKLDGRECLKCPYVDVLTKEVLSIYNVSYDAPMTYSSVWNTNFYITTGHNSLVVDGSVKLKYNCELRNNMVTKYSYIYGCSPSSRYCYNMKGTFYQNDYSGFNYTYVENLSGYRTVTMNEMYSQKVKINLFDVRDYGNEKINCNFYISSVDGELLISGKRIR
jgi:hypothetical protein